MNFRLIAATGKIIALVAVISLVSCKKDSTSSGSDNGSASNFSDSSTAADNSYYDVLNNAFVAYSDNSSVLTAGQPGTGKTTTFSKEAVNGTSLSCAIYHLDDSIPSHYPKTLTVDFGAGCTSADGILRSGLLTYVFSGPLLFPGTTASVTFNQYKVQGYIVQGTYTITNNSSEANGIVLTTQVSNGIITYPSGKSYHYSHNKSFKMTAGSNTPFSLTDDVYAITGTSSFSEAGGASIVFTVTTALVKALICHNVSAGVVGFVYTGPNASANGTIDFGDGACDNQAVVSIGAYQKTITLR